MTMFLKDFLDLLLFLKENVGVLIRIMCVSE